MASDPIGLLPIAGESAGKSRPGSVSPSDRRGLDGRAAGIAPFSVVDDDAFEVVACVARKPFPSRLF